MVVVEEDEFVGDEEEVLRNGTPPRLGDKIEDEDEEDELLGLRGDNGFSLFFSLIGEEIPFSTPFEDSLTNGQVVSKELPDDEEKEEIYDDEFLSVI